MPSKPAPAISLVDELTRLRHQIRESAERVQKRQVASERARSQLPFSQSLSESSEHRVVCDSSFAGVAKYGSERKGEHGRRNSQAKSEYLQQKNQLHSYVSGRGKVHRDRAASDVSRLQIRTLENRLSQAESLLSSQAGASDAIDQLKSSNAALSQQLAAARMAANKYRDQCDKLREELKQCYSANDQKSTFAIQTSGCVMADARSRITALTEALEVKTAQFEQLKDEVARLRDGTLISKLSNRVYRLEKENARLRGEMSHVESHARHDDNLERFMSDQSRAVTKFMHETSDLVSPISEISYIM